MRAVRHLTHVARAARPRVVAAGAFDGLHRGHQQLLARLVECTRAVHGESVVVVAREHGTAPRLLDLRRQLEGLRDAGIDLVVFAPRVHLAAAVERMAPAIRITAVGDHVPAAASGRLERVAVVEQGGERVSADVVRAALARGDLDTARVLLGRDPGVGGRVVHGFHRGAPLGIPTANLRVRGIQLPPDGVYAVRARIGRALLRGVANIGFNPTFGNQVRTVETHLFDFSADAYRRRLDLGFACRLRGERKFPDVPALVAQIRADIDAARAFFAQHGD